MYWVIQEEGTKVNNENIYMSKGLRKYLFENSNNNNSEELK
jgi:hypothetical protein